MEQQEQKMVTLQLSQRDALVVKAILEQQLINNGMATYMAVAQQLQGQLPQPEPQGGALEENKKAEKKKK